ncbi:PREDICTED: uncharacterized protein LOC106125610 isoform X1 [Papilio xuthus]|uniref:Uncharacterized protein LOC106125610 isoform X1 n=1 Tax=Papilio xuthus TaxID=66420 RepID=A0AAJ6ZSE6_PAPXU|nr:PREDICTED: uncharacterized protein LOC106125610 isoform X1 [Papilio xuthus]
MFVDIVKIVCIYLLIDNASSSLLSRIRNRHEYIPDADLEVIRSLDDKTYEDLMNEIPILRQVFKGSRRDGTSGAPHTHADSVAAKYLAAPTSATFEKTMTTATLPLTTEHSLLQTRTRPTRRTHWPPINYRVRESERGEQEDLGEYEMRAIDKFPHVFSCYWCGLNDTLLPNTTVCYEAFQSPQYRLYGLSRFFRAHCHFNDTRHSTQHRINRTYPHYFEFADDPGLKLMVIGPFMKGCFKRFVDVGTLYTARGCRGLYHPWRSYTRSFASHRLAKLEILTRGFDDRCVSSPEASLTPFSRDISLFVRYHVCVCSKPYCNLAALHHIVHVYHTILLLFCSRMYVLVYNLI